MIDCKHQKTRLRTFGRTVDWPERTTDFPSPSTDIGKAHDYINHLLCFPTLSTLSLNAPRRSLQRHLDNPAQSLFIFTLLPFSNQALLGIDFVF